MGEYAIPIIVIVILGIVVGPFLFLREKQKMDGETVSDPVIGEIADSEKQEALLLLDSLIHMVEKFEISNILGKNLVFESLDSSTALTTKRYQEITACGTAISANLIHGSLPALAQVQTLSELIKKAPNGLFTATAPMTELMTYKDGTVGSVVMKDGGGIANHAGFKQADMSVMKSAAIVGAGMQAMAMISGQYYMDKISKQLDVIQRGIERLISFHHDESIGKLRSVEHRMKEITIKRHVDETDIVALQAGIREADSVLMEYSTRLERLSKAGEFSKVKVRAFLSRFSASRELNVLRANTDEHELFYSFQICLFADKLILESRKAEFATRMKMGEIEKAMEAFEAFRMHFKHSYITNATEFLNNIYGPIDDKAEELIRRQLIKSNKSISERQSLRRRRSDLQRYIGLLIDSDTSEELIRYFTNDSEILYLIPEAGGEPKLFISAYDEIEH